MPIILDPISAGADAAVLGPVQRILRGISATIGHSFTSDGTVIDPGTATVSITTSSGTALATAATTTETTPGVFTYTLTPAQTAQLDTLTFVWSATIGGQVQRISELVEVVGGFVFTVQDARATSGLNATFNDNVTYRISTAQIVAARTEAERVLEHELGFAMVPRYATETLDGDGGRVFMLTWPYIRRLRSVTVGGVADPDSSLYTVSDSGRVYAPAALTSGYSNVTVGYEHGMTVPPPGAKDVALALAKAALVGSAADARAATVSTGEQTTSFYTPGASEPFDIPAANRFVASHTMRVGLA